MQLSPTEHGAYLLLIIAYWNRGGPLPNDDKYLAGISKLGRQWKQIGMPIMRHYFVLAGECWRHQRIQNELSKMNSLKEKKRVAGVASGVSRKHLLNRRSTEGEQQANPSPSPSPEVLRTSPVPVPRDAPGGDKPLRNPGPLLTREQLNAAINERKAGTTDTDGHERRNDGAVCDVSG